MSKEKLTHSGDKQNLRASKSKGYDAQFNGSSPPQVQNSNNQQLRSGQDEAGAYRSEEHRHVYNSQVQSFNEQRDNYAEQALNEYVPLPEVRPIENHPQYDYQAASSPGTENVQEAYQRYTGSSEPEQKEMFEHEQINNIDSIFASSDLELANSTENYLKKDSEEFERKLSKADKKIGNLQNKIAHIENKSLQYSHKQRLKFQSEKTALSEKEHFREIGKIERRHSRSQFYRRQIYGSIRNAITESDFSEDDISKEMRRKGKKVLRSAGWSFRHNYRKLKHELDGYSRLKFQNACLASLNAQKAQLSYRSGIDLQRRKAEEAARQGLLREKQKRKVKKEMVQNYKREQGNFFTRTRNQHKMKKTVKKEKKMAKKRTRTIVSAGLMMVLFLIFAILIVFIFATLLFNIFGETVANTVSQNDYYDMTEVTAYFREKEAGLEEYIKSENLEPVILAEYPEIYEFVYDMDEIGFDANTLVAYLSAKYNEFTLEIVKDDLDELFESYYTLEWEVKEEYRMIPDITQAPDPITGEYPLINKLVKICYVTLKKADFYELLKSRIDDAAKQNQMDGFYLSGNGQQIYGPVMQVDWRNKISSNYGWRVHPITGVQTFHDGVDIAVPVGTAVYSAVEGTVISSYFSDSGGNMVIIQNASGWQVTFMHMDSRTVRTGDTIKQGQLVGYSGNTGNSTGPHLHIRVHDADNNPVNPVFIIPFSTMETSESY